MKKKTGNEGFSLVELIVVIAILAILASAITMSVIHYLEDSRKSNCINTRKTMEKEYLLVKTEEENKRNENNDPDPEYDLEEYLEDYSDEYECPSGGSFEALSDGSIGCTKHGSMY